MQSIEQGNERGAQTIEPTTAILTSGTRRASFMSIVVPAYNEAQNISAFLDRIQPCLARLKSAYEIIFVDDGSTDMTAARVAERCHQDARIKLIRLSRNFGKEAALNAGLGHAVGDIVIQIDADLQHPPETIADLVTEWSAGADIVYAKRRSRETETWTRRFMARSFYRVFASISDVKLMEGAGDFILLDSKVVEALLFPARAWPLYQRALCLGRLSAQGGLV
jgi:glycosyltransferase involved in cell wall biosynthesis